jgi:peroxiredoxin
MNGKERTVQPARLVYLLVSLGLIFVLPVVSAAVEVGEKAPDFELQSTMGNTIRLSDFAGKKNVLIEFYVMDFYPGCQEAHQTRRDAYEVFQARETQVLGISVFSPYAQHAFAKTLDLPYPLLSDFPHLKTIKKYDVEQKIGDIPTAKRAYFIVDKQGVVRFKRIMSPFDVDGPYLENELLLHELDRINQKAASRR